MHGEQSVITRESHLKEEGGCDKTLKTFFQKRLLTLLKIILSDLIKQMYDLEAEDNKR